MSFQLRCVHLHREKYVYLFVVDEHGGVEGFRSPVNDVGGLGGRHVDQHTLAQEQRR